MDTPVHVSSVNVKDEVLEAEKRIREHIRETPLEYSPYLSQLGNARVFLKLENTQISGSFKLRGATNKFLALGTEKLAKGIVTMSSGNHGAAVAYLCKKFGLKGTIFLPVNTSQAKLETLCLYGVDIELMGNECLESAVFARENAEKNGQIYIPPYNDPYIIGGQGTVGIELMRQLDELHAVFVPIGGGGLISGIAGYLKSRDKNITIIGCQPKNAAAMYESIKAGKVIYPEIKPSLSEGTGGRIRKDAVTFDLCRKYVDDYVLVTEDEIKAAIILMLEKHYMLIEGAAALQVASYLKAKGRFVNKNVVLIISGSRISLETLNNVLA